MNFLLRLLKWLLLLGLFVLVVRWVLQRLREQSPPELAPTLPANYQKDERPEGADKDMADEPPPPPEPRRLNLFTRAIEGNEQAMQLWLALMQEAFTQRGEGFRDDWAFPIHAARHDLGAPLTKGQRIKVGGSEYAYQVYARDIIFNPVPKWSEVHSLANELDGAIPASGPARELLAAGFKASGGELHDDWAFHQMAVKEQLGAPLTDAYRIKVGSDEYSLQVFAGDTLYVKVPNWSDVQRLSATAAGELADALWTETYKPSGVEYVPNLYSHQFAVKEKLGTPLSGLHNIDFEGTTVQVQVFALDVVFATLEDENQFTRQSSLSRPEKYTAEAAPPPPASISAPGSPADALKGERPVFAMLPVAGQPRISQLYGYTKWSAGGGRKFYGATQGRHPGIDFAVPVGTPLLSVGHGLVVYAGPSSSAPFGGSPPAIAIVRYGNLYVIYGHSSEVKVRKGQTVTPGQVVTLSGTYGGPHLHFEVRPVPERLLNNTDPNQPAINPGYTINPLDFFNPEMQAYFERWYKELGGDSHFCRGSLRDQERITFAGPVETRPCTN
jgi:murein DD-endopeptidase MepM/ murein hydrolase activator NlpD